jgi:hypothetical protein
MIKFMERQTIKSIITGTDINQDEFEYAWQELVLGRIDKIEEDCNDIESNFFSYNNGFLDGFKLALTLEKIRGGCASRYQSKKIAK